MKHNRIYSAVLAGVIGLSALSLGFARPAQAVSKEDLYKYGTYGLGAGTVYAGVKGKGTLALIGAAGTYVAYRAWKKEAKKNDRRRRHVVVRRRR